MTWTTTYVVKLTYADGKTTTYEQEGVDETGALWSVVDMIAKQARRPRIVAATCKEKKP